MQGATWASPPARARGTLEFGRSRRARARCNAAAACACTASRQKSNLCASVARANKRQDTCVAIVLCAR
eukprot:4636221-Pleurochrysis_carterae.AAC.2